MAGGNESDQRRGAACGTRGAEPSPRNAEGNPEVPSATRESPGWGKPVGYPPNGGAALLGAGEAHSDRYRANGGVATRITGTTCPVIPHRFDAPFPAHRIDGRR